MGMSGDRWLVLSARNGHNPMDGGARLPAREAADALRALERTAAAVPMHEPGGDISQRSKDVSSAGAS